MLQYIETFVYLHDELMLFLFDVIVNCVELIYKMAIETKEQKKEEGKN